MSALKDVRRCCHPAQIGPSCQGTPRDMAQNTHRPFHHTRALHNHLHEVQTRRLQRPHTLRNMVNTQRASRETEHGQYDSDF